MSMPSLFKSGFYVFFVVIFSCLIFADGSLNIKSPTYFNEQDNVYREIHFLEDEFLSFDFCPNGDVSEYEANLICEDEDLQSENIELDLAKRTDRDCYFVNFNFEEINCDRFDLIVDYLQNNKKKRLTRSFVEQKQSMLINHVLGNDWEDLDEVDLSYYLVVLNAIDGIDSKRSSLVYESLKNSRNNDEKCWPSESCDVSDTALILNNLRTAGYPMNSRLIDDGKIFLEKNIFTNSGDKALSAGEIYEYRIEMNHGFDGASEIGCELFTDGGDIRNYIYGEDDNDFKIIRNMENNFEFSCEEEIDEITVDIYDSNDVLVDSEVFLADDRVDYFVDGGESVFYFVLRFDYDFYDDEKISCNLIDSFPLKIVFINICLFAN